MLGLLARRWPWHACVLLAAVMAAASGAPALPGGLLCHRSRWGRRGGGATGGVRRTPPRPSVTDPMPGTSGCGGSPWRGALRREGGPPSSEACGTRCWTELPRELCPARVGNMPRRSATRRLRGQRPCDVHAGRHARVGCAPGRGCRPDRGVPARLLRGWPPRWAVGCHSRCGLRARPRHCHGHRRRAAQTPWPRRGRFCRHSRGGGRTPWPTEGRQRAAALAPPGGRDAGQRASEGQTRQRGARQRRAFPVSPPPSSPPAAVVAGSCGGGGGL